MTKGARKRLEDERRAHVHPSVASLRHAALMKYKAEVFIRHPDTENRYGRIVVHDEERTTHPEFITGFEWGRHELLIEREDLWRVGIPVYASNQTGEPGVILYADIVEITPGEFSYDYGDPQVYVKYHTLKNGTPTPFYLESEGIPGMSTREG